MSVKLTKELYEGEDMDFINRIIIAHSSNEILEAFRHVESDLIREAKRFGATHVYSVDYEILETGDEVSVIGTGLAYKLK